MKLQVMDLGSSDSGTNSSTGEGAPRSTTGEGAPRSSSKTDNCDALNETTRKPTITSNKRILKKSSVSTTFNFKAPCRPVRRKDSSDHEDSSRSRSRSPTKSVSSVNPSISSADIPVSSADPTISSAHPPISSVDPDSISDPVIGTSNSTAADCVGKDNRTADLGIITQDNIEEPADVCSEPAFCTDDNISHVTVSAKDSAADHTVSREGCSNTVGSSSSVVSIIGRLVEEAASRIQSPIKNLLKSRSTSRSDSKPSSQCGSKVGSKQTSRNCSITPSEPMNLKPSEFRSKSASRSCSKSGSQVTSRGCSKSSSKASSCANSRAQSHVSLQHSSDSSEPITSVKTLFQWAVTIAETFKSPILGERLQKSQSADVDYDEDEDDPC